MMKSNTESYQGWTNYETWAVALWLDNERPSYEYWQEVVHEHLTAYPEAVYQNQGVWTVESKSVYELAERLESEITEFSPLANQVSLYSDMLSHSLSSVNWNEIMADWLLSKTE